MDIFIARQPILDRKRRVYGYELLYRSGPENVFRATCQDQASTKVIGDSMFVMGLDRLTGGRRAFINLTETVLTHDYLTLLPNEIAVYEILETIRPTPAVLEACRKLKAAGYTIALDDFMPDPSLEPRVKLADIIKIDWRQLSERRRGYLIRKFTKRGIQVVAEKIETWGEYEEAHDLGCTYFQGYFMSEPEMLKAREVPAGKLGCLQILSEIHRENLDYDRIEGVVKRDVSLTWKLLRYINSVYFGLRNEVSSIRHAVVLLGEREFKRWAALAAMSGLGDSKPQELLMQAAIRGRLCELLAPNVGLQSRAQEVFLLGMFSLLDAFLDQPLHSILPSLPIAKDVRDTLLGNPGPLRSVLDCAIAQERGRWIRLTARARDLDLDPEDVARMYFAAIEWAEASITGARRPPAEAA